MLEKPHELLNNKCSLGLESSIGKDEAHVWEDQRWLVRIEGIESKARVSTRYQSDVEKAFASRTNQNRMGATSRFVEQYMDQDVENRAMFQHPTPKVFACHRTMF